MNFSNLFFLKEEVSLIVVMVFLLLFDLFATGKIRRYFHLIACVALGGHLLYNLQPLAEAKAFGGMYVNSPVISLMKSVLEAGALIVFMQAGNWLAGEKASIKRGEFYVLMLSTLLGMFFMLSSGNFLLFFIGVETASVPMAALVAFDKYRQNAAEAGAKYILSAVFASGLMLYGVSLIYGTVGSLYFEDIPAGIVGNPIQLMAFVFFFVGMGFKISLVPFHLWTADVYEGAPTAVTSYLSVVSKGAAVFVLMMILYKVFAPIAEQWQSMLYLIILLTITVANLFALRQRNLKRFMAFSSVSQAGYLMLAVISGTAVGMASLVFYVLVYLCSNLGVFGVISVIEQRTGKVDMEDYNGLYQTNPRLSVLMMLSLFSLAGIPPFAGFFSKFFVFMSAAGTGFYVLVLLALINTIVSLYYYLLVVKAMFINKNDTPIAAFRSDNYTRVSLVMCLLGVSFLGIFSVVYEQFSLVAWGM